MLPLAVAFVIGAFAPHAPPPAPDARWSVTLSTSDGIELVVRMNLEVRDGSFELYSRPGGVNQTISWRQRLLGSLLRKLPPHGAVMVGKGTAVADGDSTILRGKIDTFLGTRMLVGSVTTNRLRAVL